jgi:hypothetical protein
MQRMRRAKHHDEKRNKTGSLECEAVNEDLHNEEFSRPHTLPACRTPVREFKIIDRTDEVPARERINWKLILS